MKGKIPKVISETLDSAIFVSSMPSRLAFPGFPPTKICLVFGLKNLELENWNGTFLFFVTKDIFIYFSTEFQEVSVLVGYWKALGKGKKSEL